MEGTTSLHHVMGDRPGDCITIKTRYGMVRIERVADHRGQIFTCHGSMEGMFLKLEEAFSAVMRELALRQQEQQ